MQGVRLFAIARGAGSWLDDERTFPVWEAARELGAHVIVTILNHQLPALQRVLKRHPDVAVSLDHCGFPDPSDPKPLFEMAENANLYCKVTSIVLDPMREQAPSFVEQLVARFGAERVMCGSDFSQTHDRPYRGTRRAGPPCVRWSYGATATAVLRGHAAFVVAITRAHAALTADHVDIVGVGPDR